MGRLPPSSTGRSSTLSPALVKGLAAVFFVAAGVVVVVSAVLPLAEGQHRVALVIVGVASVGVGLAVWNAPWRRWPAATMRWTLVPAALVLITAANYYGGIEPFTYAIAFPLVFAWLGLSQPRWTSLRFAAPAALAYLLPLLAEERPVDQLLTVAVVIPMGVALGEGCALVASRLRAAEDEVRTAGAGIERLLEATTKLGEAETEAEAADLTAELVMELLGADRVQVMVAEDEGSSRFVARGQRNIPLPVGESVVDAATEPTGTGAAVRTGQTLFVPDCRSSPFISPHLVQRIPCASAVFIPLPGEGGSLGAVAALWTAPRAELDQFSRRAAEVLSAEAGRALERTRATARLTRDLGERGRAVALLRQERTFLQLLQEVAVAANEARTVEEALQRALDGVCTYTAWPVGHAYLVDRDGSVVPSGVWHLDDPKQFEPFRRATEQARFAAGAGLPGRVVASRQPAWIRELDAHHDSARAEAARSVGVRAALGVPVLAAGEVVGVLEFFFPEARQPDESLLELVRHVGTQLGHVAQRRRIQETLQTSEERVRAVIETAGDAFVAMDDAGVVTEWNRQAELTFGWSRQEALGRTVAELIIPEELRPAHRQALQRFLATGEGTIVGRRVEMSALTRHGGEFPVEITLWATRVGSTFGFSAFVRDISERKRLEAELTRQALHDSLTGLPNRTLLLDRLEHALARGERSRTRSTVLFLDLDRFKMVNDSLGHAAGDRLLAAVSERIGGSVRPSDTVARLGGDEFAVLLEDTGTDDAVGIARRLGEALDAPFVVEGRAIVTRASVGVATGEAGSHTPDELLRNADLAMYMAKAQGRGRHAVFESTMHVAMVERLELEADMRRALGRSEFFLHYQPVVRLTNGSMVGVEALVRWKRAGAVVSPGQFIPVAEETGLILDIGRWVLHEACCQMATWHAEHQLAVPLRLSVNFSARQLQDPDLGKDIEAVLADCGLEPSTLVIEVTESLLMSEPEVAAQRLHNLRALGVRLAVDDFGTGYSSLSYLRRFPVDVLKIDRSFVAALQRGPEDAALAHAIVKLGHTLGLRTVAEGIETVEQLAELRAIGCHYGQGYLFARPLAPDAMSALLGDAVRPRGSADPGVALDVGPGGAARLDDGLDGGAAPDA